MQVNTPTRERTLTMTALAATLLPFLAVAKLYAAPLVLTLDEAIKTALEHNALLQVSETALQIARAQYDQAQSANFPHLDMTLAASRRDQDVNYIASGAFSLPQDFTNQLALSGAEVQDELAAAQTGSNNHAHLLQTAQAAQAGLIPAQTLPFKMDVTTLGRDSAAARLDLTYALYTGGKVGAVIRQADLNRQIKSEGIRRSRSEVIYDTRRYYYAVMLSEHITKEVGDTLERLKMVRDLTESFYKGGSLRVKKTDYLRTLVTVDMVRSMYEESRASVKLAKAALVNTMGLPYNTEIEVAQKSYPKPSEDGALNQLVQQAYQFNPDYAQLRLAIDVKDAKIDESMSGYLPSIGLKADASHYYNSFNGGLYTPQNRNSWTIGVGLKWNLFNGNLDKKRVEEARLDKRSMQHKEILLKNGIALQVKAAFLGIDRAHRQYDALLSATKHAAENADLNIRAYREDMVETKDVLEAQIMEAFAKSAYYKSLNDYATNKALLDFVISKSAEETETK